MQNMMSFDHGETNTLCALKPAGPELSSIYQIDFDTSLKHSNATQNIYFSNYFEWQGQARERWFIECIQNDLLQAEGIFVTSTANNQFIREAFPFQKIMCRVNSFNIRQCSFYLRFEFFLGERLSSKGYQKIAFSGHDKKLKRIPAEALRKIREYEVDECILDDVPVTPPVNIAPSLHVKNMVYSTEFRTSLKHSNATKNIYFSNYFDWQGAAREQWFYDRIDKNMCANYGFFVTALAHNDFIQEAFPFQKIRCDVHSFNIQRCCFYLGFEFFNDESLISKGYQKVVFSDHDKRIRRLPEEILQKVLRFERQL